MSRSPRGHLADADAKPARSRLCSDRLKPRSTDAVRPGQRTVQVLRAHRRRQLDKRTETTADGTPWTDTGYVFTRPDELPINPNYATPGSVNSSTGSGCRRCDWTTYATVRRPCRTRPALT